MKTKIMKTEMANTPKRIQFQVRDGWEDFFAMVLKKTGLQDDIKQYQRNSRKKEYQGADSFVFGEFRINSNPQLPTTTADSPECSRSTLITGTCNEFWYLESKYWLSSFCRNYPGAVDFCPTSYPIHFEMADEVLSSLFGSLELSVDSPWVLKRDGASGASDVHFVTSAQQARDLIDAARDMEYDLPFLEDRLPSIPGWCLQRHIDDPLLICGGYKFHIRVQTVFLGGKLYVYPDYEVRLAPKTYGGLRALQDPAANITNGGGSSSSHDRRLLLRDVPELFQLGLPIESFVHKLAFPGHGRPPWQRPGVGEHYWNRPHLFDLDGAPEDRDSSGEQSGGEAAREREPCGIQKTLGHANVVPFALLAHDIMVSADGKLHLLETNHGPACPPIEVDADGDLKPFSKHMLSLSAALLDLLSFPGHGSQCAEDYVGGHLVRCETGDPDEQKYFQVLG